MLDAIATPPVEPSVPVVFARSRGISVTPLGGGTDIGGSCILIEAGDARLLVDCGTRPKQRLSRLAPPMLDTALAGNIDAVIVTHAHNDHAGYVPALVPRYPFMDVLATADTAALLPTMWNDSVKVFERTGHERVEPGEPAGLAIPPSARGSSLLLIESTYCRANSNRTKEVERFIDTVADTVNSGGRVLVPAFALGRAQEVVLTLRNALPGVPVLVDGLAKTISRIYEQQTADGDNPLKIFGDDVKEVAPGSRREQYMTMRRGVVVTTSGMLTGGPAVTWARWLLPDPKAALLVSGYQDEESAGHELLQLADKHHSTEVLSGLSEC